MAYPVAAGGQSYSGTFIPEIWSGKLVEKFYDATVIAQMANTNYEGEISNQGDKVEIRTIPTLTISDYESGQSLVNQRPTSSNVELLIDQGKYWSAICDDVQKVQADIGLMNMWSDDASEQLKIAIDSSVLGGFFTDIAAANRGATAGRLSGNIALGVTDTEISVTKTNILDLIIDLGTVLDEQNVPEQGRYLILPAWVCGLLKKSDLKDASLTGDGTSVMRNGRLGMIDRFTIFLSNLLPGTAAANQRIFAGHKNGLTFASQLTKMETLRAESTFGEIMRGLQVYGYKVIDGTMIAEAVISKG